jgi:transmembrane sensor
MNRYTRTRMVITSPGIAEMPVSGVFRAGSSESFARALSLAYPVRVQVRDNVIEISQNNHNNL